MEKNIENSQDEKSKPLFTGDYRRDTVVSEQEKAVEASIFLWDALKRLFKKSKND